MDFINRLIHAVTELHPTHPMLVHFPLRYGRCIPLYSACLLRKNEALEQLHLPNIAMLSTIAEASPA
jgi:hypothetical protein